MPAFDDLTKVTVSSHAMTVDGNYAQGRVTFTPSAPVLQDVVSGEAIFTLPLHADFDGTGHVSISLPVTNHPSIQPQGWVYSVNVAVDGTAGEGPFLLSVPYGSAPFDLFLAAPAPDGTVYIPPTPLLPDDNWAFLLLMGRR